MIVRYYLFKPLLFFLRSSVWHNIQWNRELISIVGKIINLVVYFLYMCSSLTFQILRIFIFKLHSKKVIHGVSYELLRDSDYDFLFDVKFIEIHLQT